MFLEDERRRKLDAEIQEVDRAQAWRGLGGCPSQGVATILPLVGSVERFHIPVTCSDLGFGKISVVVNVKATFGGDSF